MRTEYDLAPRCRFGGYVDMLFSVWVMCCGVIQFLILVYFNLSFPKLILTVNKVSQLCK